MSKLWNKDFVIVCSTNFFLMLNFYLLMVIISVFTMDTFHSSPSEAGLATGIFVVSSFIARLFCGKWIERIGRKKMLYTGMISMFAVTLSYFGVNSLVFLLGIRVLHGAAYGISSTALATIVSYTIPKERRGEGIGYYASSATLATAIGPFLSMFVSRHGNFTMVFVACAIAAALGLVNALFLFVPEIELTKEQFEETKGFHFKSFLEPKAVPISIICGVVYFCFSSILSFLAPYAREIHLAGAASFFFVMFAITTFVSRPYTGRLFDSKGENFVMYPAILTFMTAMIVLSQTHYGYTLLLAGALAGLGLGVVQFGSQTIAVKVSAPHRLGLANATFFIFAEIGVGVGPFMLGLFVPLTGYRGLYSSMAIVMFACAFLYYLLHGRRVVREKRENLRIKDQRQCPMDLNK